MARRKRLRKPADLSIRTGSLSPKTRLAQKKRDSTTSPSQIYSRTLASGSHLSRNQLLQLQQSHGNQFVQRYLALREEGQSSRAPAQVQAKKVPVTTTIAGIKHPKITFLNKMMVKLKALRAQLDASPKPLKGKKAKENWKKRLWQRIGDTSALGHYKETKTNVSKWVVWLVGGSRVVVEKLTAAELKISQEQLKKIQGYYQRKLNAFSPYFTQMANMNILWKGSKKKNAAWRRTCNMTSLGMALQSLGMQPADFTGDKDTLLKIAQHFDPDFKSFANLEELRMPDFLQFVAIYLQLPKVNDKDFGKRIDKARSKAAPLLSTTLTIFEDVAKQFNVERVHTGYITSTGLLKKIGKKGTVATWKYKRKVKNQLDPWLNQGGQVVVNKKGHYVRLENIDDKGIVIDDPAKKGKNFRMSWAKTNRLGYFRSYMVFLKK